jgi:hypothetical protein
MVQRPGDGKNKHFRRAGVQQSLRAGRDGRAGGKDIVNQEDSLARDQGWVSYAESVRDRLPSTFRVHSGAVPICMRGAKQADFIQRQ